MDITLHKQLAEKWDAMPLSGDIGQSIRLPVTNGTVDNVVLTEGCWEVSILSGLSADQVSLKAQTSAAAAPAFAAINPIPLAITDGLMCFRADQVKRLVVNGSLPKIHVAHSNAGILTFLFCRVFA